jgi:hypothetical protein
VNQIELEKPSNMNLYRGKFRPKRLFIYAIGAIKNT